MKKSKKLTAVIAAGCATVMVLTGTFAWYLQQDATKLNSMKYEVSDYGVEVVEDFTPFVNKDVTVKATGSGSVIVRVRFEEFLNVEGATYSVDEVSGIYTQTHLADVAHAGTNDARMDNSILTTTEEAADPQINLVDLYFGEKVITMAEWNTLITEKTGADLAAIYDAGYWVIDDDGWCYYTKAIKNQEESNLLMANALLNKTDEELSNEYGSPSTVNYNINVRVQAISADLSDYGSTTDNTQWTCLGSGRVIDKTDNPYEITTDTPVAAGSDADKLIRGVADGGGYAEVGGYKFALSQDAEGKKTAILNGFASTTTALSDLGTGYTDGTLTLPSTVTKNETEYTVVGIGANAFASNSLLNQFEFKLVLPDKLVRIESAALKSIKVTEVTIPMTVEYLGFDCMGYNYNLTKVTFDGSITNTPKAGEATKLELAQGVFYLASKVTGNVQLPARTTSIYRYAFQGWTANVTYPDTASVNGSAFNSATGTHGTYTPTSN